MRLLIINPNTSQGVTDRIREAANGVARSGDVFTTLCPAFGPELIVTPDDAEQARRAVVETVKTYDKPCDGIVLASFGNTGAQEVRALRPDIPVIGIASAAFSIAAALGGPFGIVTFGQSLVADLQTKAAEAGMADLLLGTAALEITDFGDPGTVQIRHAEGLRQLCLQMHQRGAKAVVMGGGPLAGLAAKLAPACPVPLIDGTQGALNILRTVAACRVSDDAD